MQLNGKTVWKQIVCWYKNMLIPFEIHITLADLPLQRTADFIAACTAHNAKPMLIELAQGAFQRQPMLSKVVEAASLHQAHDHAQELTAMLRQQQFIATRIKIEIPAADAAGYVQRAGEGLYYEWHGKVHYRQPEDLLALCLVHQVHLSANALRNQADVRFVTLRETGTYAVFESRLQQLTGALAQNGWPVIKQQAEYCIYDNNIQLDAGWLPQ